MIPAEWQRWIILSCNKHVKTILDASQIFVQLEGFPRDLEGKDEWFEVRVDVSRSNEQSHSDFKLEITIDILCVVMVPRNAYRIHELVGLAQGALHNTINITDENGTFKEFMRREPTDTLRVTTFKTQQKATQTRMSSVEAMYRLYMES